MVPVHRLLYLLRLALLFRCAVFRGTNSFRLSGVTHLPGESLQFHRCLRAYARPETVDRVTSILATKFEKDSKSIELDCNYRKEFNADNLDEVELLLALEEEFDLTIPDYDFNDLHTVKDLADYVERQVANKNRHAG